MTALATSRSLRAPGSNHDDRAELVAEGLVSTMDAARFLDLGPPPTMAELVDDLEES